MTTNNHTALVVPMTPSAADQNRMPPQTLASLSEMPSIPSFAALVVSLLPLQANMPETIDALKARVLKLQSDNTKLVVHCALAKFELQKKMRKLNAHKTRPTKKQKVKAFSDTLCLTSFQFIAYLEQESEAHCVKEQEKEVRQQAQAAKENEASQQHLTSSPDTPFGSSLASKKKEKLKTLTHTLALLLDGTVKQLNKHNDI
ncbi:hypothetical protein BDN71DRAFT_1502421 [Pleurotus eryngii]|uniref:Uncharacterized protein n=1 Tax=Pleurotus eryngii TaxID=5323 RepID=A0A9P6A832_PLEER|nr:hypothetical protein BDN71DRAFT_1502421 [Pleurotus eryngii]